MRKDNPAVFECPKGRNKLHTWRRLGDGRAQCKDCKLVITREDADEVFDER